MTIPVTIVPEEIRTHTILLGGGENLVASGLEVAESELLFSRNYESAKGKGYRRIDGYERFDGRTAPSAASYWILNYDAGTGAISEGDVVTGAGGASGTALIDQVGTVASGYLVLTGVTGTYVDDEDLSVSGKKCEANGTAVEKGASTDALHDTYIQDAEETARTAIQVVAGDGVIRGICSLNGTKYVFRDDGAVCKVYKSTTAGWSEVTGKTYLAFNAVASSIAVGDTITGAISTETATVDAVNITGTWTTGSGRLYISSASGAFTDTENLQVGGVTKATADGTQATVSLTSGGDYRFVTYNFGGHASTKKIYGCDGVNPAFEFDGTSLYPILTGMTTDTPTHIAAHKNYLFLSFAGGSLQLSSLGAPMTWSPITGSAEIGIGAEITGLLSHKQVLAIFGRNSTNLLYYTYGSPVVWEMKTLSPEAGAIEGSVQELGVPFYLDDWGITTLQAVDTYGDFNASTLSQKVQPVIDAQIGNLQSSMRVKAKDQFRLFFSSGLALYGRLKGNKMDFTRVFFPVVVYASWSGEASNGSEELFFGSDDGYVYQLDSGNSFDGTEVTAYMKTSFNNIGSPRHIKQYNKIVVETESPDDITLEYVPDFSYGDPDIPGSKGTNIDADSATALWDVSVWENFVWDRRTTRDATGALYGHGRNIGMMIRSAGTYDRPHTIQSLIYHYSHWGLDY